MLLVYNGKNSFYILYHHISSQHFKKSYIFVYFKTNYMKPQINDNINRILK